MFLSVVAYYVFTLFAGRPENNQTNSTLSYTFIGIALSAVLISLPIKSKLLNRAIEQQQVQLVQQGYILTWAITEVGALLGIVDFFVTANPLYYVPMIIAGCGQLLHFPRREHVVNASSKTPIF